MFNKYRAKEHPGGIDAGNYRYIIQEKRLFSDWKFYARGFPNKEYADLVASLLNKSNDKVFIGHTKNCVNCGCSISESNSIACGSVFNGDRIIIIARFCNQLCLRDASLKGLCDTSPYLDDYGVEFIEKPFS